jgi:hypothetical protein
MDQRIELARLGLANLRGSIFAMGGLGDASAQLLGQKLIAEAQAKDRDTE